MNIKKIIKSIYLCIKYPFLYPENDYTNYKLKHYLYGSINAKYDKNAKKLIRKKVPGIIDKAYKIINIELDYPDQYGNNIRTVKHCKNYLYVIWFHILNFIMNNVLPIFHYIPTYTKWDDIPEGWAKAFGKQYLKELGDAVKRMPKKKRKQFCILQIKEKWSKLIVYVACASDEVYDIIHKYEDLSYKICINCGKPAVKYTSGWVCPYCEDCFNKITNNRKKFLEKISTNL